MMASQHIQFNPLDDDKWGNHGVGVNIQAEALYPVLKTAEESTSRHNVYTVSWQLGEQEVFYSTGEGGRTQTVALRSEHKADGNDMYFVFVVPEDPAEKTPSPLGGEEQVINGTVYFVLEDGSRIEAVDRDMAEEIFDASEAVCEREVIDGHVNRVSGMVVDEAYRPEVVEKGVREIKKLATRNKNDLYVMAAGNNYNDLRGQELPKNTITVAEWRGNRIKRSGTSGTIYGANIYVPNDKLNIGRGSSLSTPFISALAERLIKDGVANEQVCEVIQEKYCTREKYRARTKGESQSVVEQAYVIDVDKIKADYPNLMNG
jgi:hypothetical protein